MFDCDLIHFNSSHCSHVNRLTCLQCFLQGDMGLTGPPGIPGPPVSTIYSTVPFIYTVICVLDQSSVSFKSAAGKRSMVFHSAHKVAAIKTNAPHRGTASIKTPKTRRRGLFSRLSAQLQQASWCVIGGRLRRCCRMTPLRTCQTCSLLLPCLWLTGEARCSRRVRNPRRAGELQPLTLFELSIHASLLCHRRLTHRLSLLSDRVRGGRLERQVSRGPRDPRVSL